MEDKDQRPQEGEALCPPESGAIMTATKTGHEPPFQIDGLFTFTFNVSFLSLA